MRDKGDIIVVVSLDWSLFMILLSRKQQLNKMDIQNTSIKFVRSDFELIERLSDCPHDLFNEKLD